MVREKCCLRLPPLLRRHKDVAWPRSQLWCRLAVGRRGPLPPRRLCAAAACELGRLDPTSPGPPLCMSARADVQSAFLSGVGRWWPSPEQSSSTPMWMDWSVVVLGLISAEGGAWHSLDDACLEAPVERSNPWPRGGFERRMGTRPVRAPARLASSVAGTNNHSGRHRKHRRLRVLAMHGRAAGKPPTAPFLSLERLFRSTSALLQRNRARKALTLERPVTPPPPSCRTPST